MSDDTLKFRGQEAEQMSEADQARVALSRRLHAILQALPKGQEGLVSDLASAVEGLVQAIAAEEGRTVGEMKGALTAISERLAVAEESATIDKTGVLNRKTFEERGQALLNQCRREGKPLACIFVDLDYFKQINDTHGHLAGDRVLQDLAKLLQYSCRPPGDVVGRYGGEEFAILLPGVDDAMVGKIMERLRVAIEQFFFRNGSDTTRLQVTASLGAAVAEAGNENLEGLIARADEAMYQAKNWKNAEERPAGRNMAVLSVLGEEAGGTKEKLFFSVSPEDRMRPRNAPRDGSANLRAGEAAPGFSARRPTGLKGPLRK